MHEASGRSDEARCATLGERQIETSMVLVVFDSRLSVRRKLVRSCGSMDDYVQVGWSMLRKVRKKHAVILRHATDQKSSNLAVSARPFSALAERSGPVTKLDRRAICPISISLFVGSRLWDPPVQLPDRKSTRLNSSHSGESRMPSSA